MNRPASTAGHPAATPQETDAERRPPRLSHHLLELLRPWRARLLVIAVLVLAAAVLELVPPLVVRHVIDHGLGRG